MPHTKSESLTGRLPRLLFSPKGGIEGLLMKVGRRLIQVSTEPLSAGVSARNEALGKPIEVQGAQKSWRTATFERRS